MSLPQLCQHRCHVNSSSSTVTRPYHTSDYHDDIHSRYCYRRGNNNFNYMVINLRSALLSYRLLLLSMSLSLLQSYVVTVVTTSIITHFVVVGCHHRRFVNVVIIPLSFSLSTMSFAVVTFHLISVMLLSLKFHCYRTTALIPLAVINAYALLRQL